MKDFSHSLLTHFRHPQYVGELTGPLFADCKVYRAQAKIASGDKVQLDIAVHEGVIIAAKYQVYGCPATIACMSWLAEAVTHQSCTLAAQISAQEISQALELPARKFRCALLAEEVLRKVLLLNCRGERRSPADV